MWAVVARGDVRSGKQSGMIEASRRVDMDINSALAHHLRSQWSPTVEKAADATPHWPGTLARISSVPCDEDVFVQTRKAASRSGNVGE